MLAAARRKGTSSSRGPEAWRRGARSLRERFNEIQRVDFFDAPARRGAAASLAALELVTAGRKVTASGDLPRLSVSNFRTRRWVTRPRPGVDRMASAWLIRRFIDPKARFAFVERPADADVPFDMYMGDFSHQGSLCTFEVLAQRFDLRAPLVERIGQIVHDLDMKETRYAPAEAPAIGRLIDGLRQVHTDDHVLLRQGIGIFEALARSFSSADAVPAGPAGTRTVGKARRTGRLRTRRRGA
jgi:hypothetical protein